MAVVSSSKNAAAVLAASGLEGFFAAVIDGLLAEREHLASKPAPDMFLAGARALGVDATACLAIEDALSGVASAAAAGCLVIAVDRGAGAAALEAAGANLVVSDLDILLPAFDEEKA